MGIKIIGKNTFGFQTPRLGSHTCMAIMGFTEQVYNRSTRKKPYENIVSFIWLRSNLLISQMLVCLIKIIGYLRNVGYLTFFIVTLYMVGGVFSVQTFPTYSARDHKIPLYVNS